VTGATFVNFGAFGFTIGSLEAQADSAPAAITNNKSR